jgi:hypothetical protein
MRHTTFLVQSKQNLTRVFIVFGLLVAAFLLLRAIPASAHNATGSGFFDMLSHSPPNANLGAGESKRWWADDQNWTTCQTSVEKIQLPDGPGGVKRAVYKFKVWANVNGRGHAMEAGGFSDSLQPWCTDQNGAAWDGQQVITANGMFIDPTYGLKPSRVKIGATGTDQPWAPNDEQYVRDSVPHFDLDIAWKNLAGITDSTAGGAFGFQGDTGGYRINNQNIWCAGLDIADINKDVLGVPTNVQWPGIYRGDCFENFLFHDGGNYQTTWGSFTIGAMKDGFAKRCGFFCGIGSEIPGIQRDAQGRVNNFALDVAGIKNHDGVGTYNNNPVAGAIPNDPCTGSRYPSADIAAIYRDNGTCGQGYWVLSQPIAEAWLTMEWDPAPPADATVYVSKYDPTSHAANGDFSNVSAAVNAAKVCMTNTHNVTFACNTNPGETNAVPYNGWNKPGIWISDNDYKVSVDVPAGFSVTKAVVNSSVIGVYNPAVTCVAGSPTVCSITLHVRPGEFNFVDFWFGVPPSCGNLELLDPTANNNPFPTGGIEVGKSINVAINEPNGLSGATQFSISNLSSSPGGLNGFSGSYGPVATGGGNKIVVGGVNSNNPQIYDINYTVSWNGPLAGSTNCPGQIKITTKPYLRVYGNDIRAGGSQMSDGVCASPSNPKATVLTFADFIPASNREYWRGSATQFAVYALGEISYHVSAGQNSPRNHLIIGDPQAKPVLDLTLGNFDPANEISDHPGAWNTNLLDTHKVEGFGGVGGMQGCVDDYVEAISKSSSGTAAPASFSGPSVVISGQLAQYRNGDVFINTNFDYPATWADNNIPSYYLAVKGNIYVSGSVSRLAGTFIAQEDPDRDPTSDPTGRIYTCAPSSGSLYSASQIYANCNNKLTVNGAFIAKQIKFQRSNNSVRDGNPFEIPVGAGPFPTSNGAEVFDFNPALYMATPNAALRRGSAKVQYDFITSLPPIL